MEGEVRNPYHTRAASGGGHNIKNNSPNTNRLSQQQQRRQIAERDLLLQWGSRKRLRCVRKEGNSISNAPNSNNKNNNVSNDYCSSDKVTSASPAAATRGEGQQSGADREPAVCTRRATAALQRVLRNSEAAAAAAVKSSITSPENGGKIAVCSEEKKGSSSGSEGAAWPPKFAIALTNKEKEEDFLVFKGSRLPQRPKKRAKIIQRTLNLVSPGAWLCDLTLERYEVREKKVSKKRPRGLKAMGSMNSDSE